MELTTLLGALIAGILAYSASLYVASEIILINTNGGLLKAFIQGIEITLIQILMLFIPLGSIITFLIVLSQIKFVYRTTTLYAFLIALIASFLYEGLVYLILMPF